MALRMLFRPALFAAAALLLVAGFAAGALIPWPTLFGEAAPAPSPASGEHAGHDHGAHEEHADGESHIDVSPTAKASLGLKTARVKLSDYVRTLHVPGEIVEAPGYSTAEVPARVAGVVTAIHVAPGQAVRPGDPLFDLELTGEALAEAQSRLLDDLQQLATNAAELERLEPITGGAVAAKQRIQLEYDQRRIEGQRNTRIQELLIRGLTRDQIDRIVTNRELVRTITVAVPDLDLGRTPPGESETSNSGEPDDWEYTVESIDVHPGESVAPEKSLARLARHTRLHVEGHAFERDVPVIAALGRDDTVAVEFGSAGHGGIDGPAGDLDDADLHGEVIDGLRVLYLDNHVDPESQTFSFYVPLRNEVLRDVIDDSGRLFRSWKFKPGQRVHVRAPVERLEQQLVLPAEAVATEGIESFVFRLAGRHTLPGKGPDGESLRQEMYEPVPVAVTHRDRDAVVVASGGELRQGDVIARNRAYQLLLALCGAAEGGGGHHGHEH